MIDDKGEPAFPQPDEANRWAEMRGMPLRDYFAAKAAHVVLEHLWAAKIHVDNVYTIAAMASYELADAMLKAREL